jgi:hypothetical protein
VGAGVGAVGEQAQCLLSADGPAPLARHGTVAAVDLRGRPAHPDAEFDDPLRHSWLRTAPAFLLGLPPRDLGDLAVDAGQPHRVPHPECVQPLEIRRQVIEHIFDSKLTARPSRSHVRFNVR